MTITTDPLWADFAFARLVTDHLTMDDHTVVLDLIHIPALHSPGLANLVTVYVHLQRRGKVLRLRNLSAMNRKVLAMTRLDQLMTIVD